MIAWILAIAATAALTTVIVLLALNFTPAEKRLTRRVRHQYGSDSAQFRRSMGILLGPGIVDGNRVETLVNGRRIFGAMLAAIAKAERTITFETFVYWQGEVGERFCAALSERAQAGVKVHVLLDWVGSQSIDAKLIETLESAGAEVKRYHPPTWTHLSRMNNRTHRKLLIIDGRIGFTGGVGIADSWDGDAEDPEHWRDTHYRVEGPVVAQMQAVFVDNWIKVSGTTLHSELYFPELAPAGTYSAHMFSSSPSGGAESMHLMYLLLIAAAVERIDLQAAYFVPDRFTVEALVEAIKRGVSVRLMVPGRHIDHKLVREASRGLWGKLLNAGIEIHEYLPTMFHCKVLIIDQRIVSIGSTNFDPRSFSLNDEANLNVYDREFAAEQLAIFESDLAHCRQVSLRGWRKRPWTKRVRESVALMLRSQL